MSTSMTMEKGWNHMTEKILGFTLEIIHLLTGEDYKVVKKKSGEPLTLSSGLQGTQPNMGPSSHSEVKSSKRLLEVAQNIIDLLTGEFSIRCQDVTVHFSMEEWEYLEGHKDLYKDVMIASQPSHTSPDGSSSGNPPEKCPRDFIQDDPIPHHQDKDMIDLKLVIKEEEEEMMESGDQQPMKGILESNKVKSSIDIGKDGRYLRNKPDTSPILPPYYKPENNGVRQSSSELNSITQNLQHRPEPSMNPSNRGEMSEKSHSATSDVHSGDKPAEPSNPKTPSLSHEDLPTGKTSLSCLGCGKTFTTRPELNAHLRSHTRVTFTCSECGISFPEKNAFLAHQRVHMGVTTAFSCSQCGFCFTQKGSLLTHQRIHTGERPYSCSECGKTFNQKGNLTRHEKTHTR